MTKRLETILQHLEAAAAQRHRGGLEPADAGLVVAECRRLRAALAVYADPANWAAGADEDTPAARDWWHPRGAPLEENLLGYLLARRALGEGE